MDDLKQKFLTFVKKQGHVRSVIAAPQSYTDAPQMSTTDCLHIIRGCDLGIKRNIEDDSLADQDVLECIESAYFTSENFDPCNHELKKLPEIVNCSLIEEDFKRLSQQHRVVSKKVLQLILQKQSACNEEFVKILNLQQELQNALKICRDGRTHLNHGKRQFTTASLGILANYKKRQLVQGLLHSLNTIKTLQRTEERLQELLSEGNYPGAISLLLECQSASVSYRHFACVAALSGKLQDTLDMAEEQLDQALAKVCNNFDADQYNKIQAGYRLLGKTQMAMDQLHTHFASSIQNTAFNVVHGYVQLCPKSDDSEIQSAVHKKQYKSLCKCVTSESFIPCLIDLCKALWEILKSYHQVSKWHAKNDTEKIPTDNISDPVDFEASYDKRYVKQKLEYGLCRVWHDVQARISLFLLGTNLAWYKFEEILQVLGVVHRLIEVGEEFCGSKSEELQNSIRQQSRNYFKNYHQGQLDELRIFLENDGWEICPVKPSFTLLQLQEFKSLRHILKSWKPRDNMVSSPDYSSSNHSQDGSSLAGGYFSRYSETGSPFDIGVEDIQDEDILPNINDEPSGYFSDDSDEDISEELKKDFVDENVGEPISKPTKFCSKKEYRREMKIPIVTNTTLTVLRQCGKYLQMSRLLRPIAGEVMAGMSQLFEYYLYAVHSFFTSDLPQDSYILYSIKLQNTLKRIEDTLILPQFDLQDAEIRSSKGGDRIVTPQLSSVVDLNLHERLHGLAERVVAVESTIFLAKQFELLQGYLEHIIPVQEKHILQQFYMQTIGVATELRRPVYMCVAARAIDLKTTLKLMSKINWEVKEVMSQHSPYVDILLKELQIFSMRFEETASKVPIPREVYTTLWENVLRLNSNIFVEGFSKSKKCSHGGRALMQLDFTQFLSKLEKLTSIRPIPFKEHVEIYIKAYYLPETAFEGWIREHSEEYSSKQLLALVNCACQNNKKLRQRLVTLIEDMG